MTTEKHGLETPEKGTADWHIPLNENFKKLDKASVLQVPTVDDLKANYSPSDETLAFIEDAKELWSGTGNSWVHVAYLKQTPHDVYVQSSEPDNADEYDVWIEP